MEYCKLIIVVLLIIVGVFAPKLGQAHAQKKFAIIANIDLSRQKMRVYVNGKVKYLWDISSGTRGYRTPVGDYTPKRLHRRWTSTIYKASMPYSVFFYKGYAVHATNQIAALGTPASHGCVRLHPTNAAKLFKLIKKYGMKNVRIAVRTAFNRQANLVKAKMAQKPNETAQKRADRADQVSLKPTVTAKNAIRQVNFYCIKRKTNTLNRKITTAHRKIIAHPR